MLKHPGFPGVGWWILQLPGVACNVLHGRVISPALNSQPGGPGCFLVFP